jgi:hypothetical protein
MGNRLVEWILLETLETIKTSIVRKIVSTSVMLWRFNGRNLSVTNVSADLHSFLFGDGMLLHNF